MFVTPSKSCQIPHLRSQFPPLRLESQVNLTGHDESFRTDHSRSFDGRELADLDEVYSHAGH